MADSEQYRHKPNGQVSESGQVSRVLRNGLVATGERSLQHVLSRERPYAEDRPVPYVRDPGWPIVLERDETKTMLRQPRNKCIPATDAVEC